MGHISSVNFANAKSWQIWHNSSERPDYAIGGELRCNRNGYEALELRNQFVENAKESYKRVCKAKNKEFQAKAYDKSAVFNIKPDTTMEDLERLAEYFETRYGFRCYQIAIHRDEGHIDENGNKVINHHAHLEFITLDKNTGKNNWRKITAKELRQIQTDVAEILGMERGVDRRLSGTKRIEPRRGYAQMKEAENAEQKKLKEEAEAKLESARAAHIKNIDTFLDRIDDALGIDTRKFNNKEAFSAQLNEIKNTKSQNTALKSENAKLENEIKITKTYIKEEFEKRRQKIIATGRATKEHYAELGEAKKNALSKGITNAELIDVLTYFDAMIQDLQNLQNVDKDAEERAKKLSADYYQVNEDFRKSQSENSLLNIELQSKESQIKDLTAKLAQEQQDKKTLEARAERAESRFQKFKKRIKSFWAEYKRKNTPKIDFKPKIEESPAPTQENQNLSDSGALEARKKNIDNILAKVAESTAEQKARVSKPQEPAQTPLTTQSTAHQIRHK